MQSGVTYKRLPGSGHHWGGFARLYAGTDHLLSITGPVFREKYKRFYYRDIQALLIRKTWVGRAGNIGSAALAALFALAGIAGGGNAQIWYAFAGSFCVLLIANSLLGPTCVCHIKTAVQSDVLHSLKRYRTASKFLARLKSLVTEVQGTVSREQLQAGIPDEPAPAPLPAGDPARRAYGGGVHRALFFALFVDGSLTAASLVIRNVAFHVLATMVTLGMIALAATALTAQQNSGVGRGLRQVTWAVLGCLVAQAVWSTFEQVFFAMTPGSSPFNQWDLFLKTAEQSPLDSPARTTVYSLAAVLEIGLSIAGDVLVSRFRRGRATSVPAP
ncbi:MAG: hypothetical protein HY897_17905 [Deltaproteobacteria bacterium]|nr:hypothetical protein [Deltaproteobacteria bacterium]